MDWWWDGSERGDFWAWVVALAGSLVLLSLGALLTAGGDPLRGVAVANLVNGTGAASGFPAAPTSSRSRRSRRTPGRQPPQVTPAPLRRATSPRSVAPAAITSRMRQSVTARQWHTYIWRPSQVTSRSDPYIRDT